MKQIYKVLLMSCLLVSSYYCDSLAYSYDYVQDVIQLSMNVGGTMQYTLDRKFANVEWEVIGDQVSIATPTQQVSISEDIQSSLFTYDDWLKLERQATFFAVKPGKCIVIAKGYYNKEANQSLYPAYLSSVYYYRIEITVNGTDPQSMVMQHRLHLGVGQEHTLSPRLLPSGTSSTLTWYSTNTNVATVSGGKITAVAVGDATITCITANGLREDCEVTVTPTMVSNLSLNQDQLQMSVGDTYQFSTAIAPENASYKQVTWTSMNPDVVSIDNNGLMSCLSNGWSVILATTVDGSNLTAGCFVQVGASEGGDVNGDGVISIKDVTELIDRLLRG